MPHEEQGVLSETQISALRQIDAIIREDGTLSRAERRQLMAAAKAEAEQAARAVKRKVYRRGLEYALAAFDEIMGTEK